MMFTMVGIGLFVYIYISPYSDWRQEVVMPRLPLRWKGLKGRVGEVAVKWMGQSVLEMSRVMI